MFKDGHIAIEELSRRTGINLNDLLILISDLSIKYFMFGNQIFINVSDFSEKYKKNNKNK